MSCSSDSCRTIYHHGESPAFTVSAAEALAKAFGLRLGGPGTPFAGNYTTKGLYAYQSGKHKGAAFFGTGGSEAQMVEDVDGQSAGQYRPGQLCPNPNLPHSLINRLVSQRQYCFGNYTRVMV